MKIVVDSYAWLEIFSGTARGAEARDAIGEADRVFTPDLVLAEVARKYSREGIREKVTRRRLAVIVETSEVSCVDDVSAVEAAKAYGQLEKKARNEKLATPSLFDAIVLAVARVNHANVLTGDRHFRGLDETLWLGL